MASSNQKKRECPALGRIIRRNECGEWRHAEVKCPADCPFNPFGPGEYGDAYKRIEDRGYKNSMDALGASLDEDERRRWISRLELADDIESQCFALSRIYFNKDASGQSVIQRLASEPSPSLKNDDRQMLMGMARTEPAVIEIRSILNDRLVEVMDLSSGEDRRLLVCDFALAARSCRFDTYLTWIFPMPHYWRLNGFMLPFRPINDLDGWQVLQEIIRHQGGDPAHFKSDPLWLMEHLREVVGVQEKAIQLRNQQMFAGIDAWWHTGNYISVEPAASAKLVKLLDRHDELLNEPVETEGSGDPPWATHDWGWLDKSSGGKGMHKVRGTVLHNAFENRWRIEAMSMERYQVLKLRFENLAAGLVRFTGEESRNLAEDTSFARTKPVAEDEVPPALRSQSMTLVTESLHSEVGGHGDIVAGTIGRIFAKWLDEAVPMLDNKTPRQAATDPQLRQPLVSLVKGQVNSIDQQNLRNGSRVDIQDSLRELGIDELMEPAPPPRQRPPTRDYADDRHPDDDFWTDEGDEDWDTPLFGDDTDDMPDPEALKLREERIEREYLSRPYSPRIQRKLNEEDIQDRLDVDFARYEDSYALLEEFNHMGGSDFVSVLRAFSKDIGLGEKSIAVLLMALVPARACLVEFDHRIQRMDPESLKWRYQSVSREFEKLLDRGDSNAATDFLQDACLQPNVYLAATETVFELHNRIRLREKEVTVLLVAIRVLIDLICLGLGPPGSRRR